MRKERELESIDKNLKRERERDKIRYQREGTESEKRKDLREGRDDESK